LLDLSPARGLGKYRLVGELARGGMGIVHLAVAQGPGGFSKLLILKELKPEFVEDPTFLPMFLEEARVAARLEHRNIVHTVEVGEESGRYYITMEYLQGQTLARIRRRNLSPMPELRILTEVLEGLHFAHTLRDYDGATHLGIVHRDVSPQNVFVTYAGEVKILDFGVAKSLDSQLETKNGVLKGKTRYMAPEQVRGEPIDARADVYATGVMAWEAVAGRRLWNEESDVQVLTSILKNEVPAIRSVKPDTPEDLARIVDKAMALNVRDRYPSAEAFRCDLQRFLRTVNNVPSLGEIGEQVALAFEPERDQVRCLIKRQLREMREGSTAMLLPPIADLGGVCSQAGSFLAVGSNERSLEPGTLSSPSNGAEPKSSDLRRMLVASGVVLSAGIFSLGIALHRPSREAQSSDLAFVEAPGAPMAGAEARTFVGRVEPPGPATGDGQGTAADAGGITPLAPPTNGAARVGTVLRLRRQAAPPPPPRAASPATTASSLEASTAAAPTARRAAIVEDSHRVPILER
jgi:serine/threonine protein kinase